MTDKPTPNYWKLTQQANLFSLKKQVHTKPTKAKPDGGKDFKPVLKDLTRDDIRKIRDTMQQSLEPRCLSFGGLSRTSALCMKQVADGPKSYRKDIQRMAYHAEKQELAVTDGYTLMVYKTGSDIFDKSGAFDIASVPITARTKGVAYADLPWLDDEIKYPDYHALIEKYGMNGGEYYAIHPLNVTFNLLAIVKALTEKPEMKKDYGLITLGPEWTFNLQGQQHEKMSLGAFSQNIKPVQLNVGYFYQALLFLTENQPQAIRVKQHTTNHDIQPMIFETDTRFVMLMPVKY